MCYRKIETMLPISSFNITLHQQKIVLASSGSTSILVLYSLFQIELAAYIPQLGGGRGGRKVLYYSSRKHATLRLGLLKK